MPTIRPTRKKFHQLFAGNGKTLAPVKHDNNQSLRANIYRNKNSFAEQAGMHFNMPVNNGGMYLEGTPERTGNHAEFVAYQREQVTVHNLGHEYIHYLDGRFNLYGDFCANLHDSHAAPENCPKPAPQTPYLVWWGEGLAEYIAHGNEHATALAIAAKKTYRLSELFDTGYEKNNDSARIYSWGYLAVRFMLENHRDEIDRMLAFTRVGDYPRYQALVRSWGTSFDAEFADWLDSLASK
nr:collagenase [uncultured Undibacterium sp.]